MTSLSEEHNDLREKVLSACSGSILTSVLGTKPHSPYNASYNLVTPLDVVKVRLQSQSAIPKAASLSLSDAYIFCGEFFDHVEPYSGAAKGHPESLVRSQRRITGTFSGFKYIIENEGAHNLWRGLLPTLYSRVYLY